MIKIQGHIPRKVYIACSGGVDSMAITDFLKNNHDVTLLYYNHGTNHGNKSLVFLREYADYNGLELIYDTINDPSIPKGESAENYWRQHRYNFLYNFDDAPVITCHHLDDCVETWIWSSLNGQGKIIPYRNRNIIRPFMLNTKSVFMDWCKRKNVSWIQDESNYDMNYTRNYIRSMMHVFYSVNPGINTVIKKKVQEQGVSDE